MEDELDRRFDYHPPTDMTRDRHNEVRAITKAYAVQVKALMGGESREVSLFLTSLEEASFWAHAHLARNVK